MNDIDYSYRNKIPWAFRPWYFIAQTASKTMGVSPWMKKPCIISKAFSERSLYIPECNIFKSQEDSKGGYSIGLVGQTKNKKTPRP